MGVSQNRGFRGDHNEVRAVPLKKCRRAILRHSHLYLGHRPVHVCSSIVQKIQMHLHAWLDQHFTSLGMSRVSNFHNCCTEMNRRCRNLTNCKVKPWNRNQLVHLQSSARPSSRLQEAILCFPPLNLIFLPLYRLHKLAGPVP